MTKEEFLTMVETELAKMEKEYSLASQKVDYFRAINPSGKELQDALYECKRISGTCAMLRSLVALPAYARIQAMSDIEIEEYKKEKIEELELEIKKIEDREKECKEELARLKAEQEHLIASFNKLSGSEKELAVKRGQEIQTEISRYNSDLSWGIFTSLKREIEEIRAKQEQIRAKTSEEIKKELASEIDKGSNLARSIENTSTIGAPVELLASVASDPQKTQEMANLLKYYKELSAKAETIKSKMYLPYRVPNKLVLYLNISSGYDKATDLVSDPDRLIEIVERFEATFEQEKAKFMEQFTEQKLSKLLDRKPHSTEVDMAFLKQHSDKIVSVSLEYLQSIVEQRDKLSKKIIKTESTKQKINSLNYEIEQLQETIYTEITDWYRYYNKDILGLRDSVHLYSDISGLRRSLDSMKDDINQSEQALTMVKARIQAAKKEIEQQRSNIEARKEETAKRIRSLGGDKFEQTDMPYASDRADYNVDQIVSAHNSVYQRDVVDRVQQEAQNQANTKEAELRGITIEELLQMKAQALQGRSMASTEEEISHGTGFKR